MITPYLPASTFPGFDNDVAPIQAWHYVMVKNGPDEGPFWQWAKNAKNKTKNASVITNSTASMWEWNPVTRQWRRVLRYEPGMPNPYVDSSDYFGSAEEGEYPDSNPPEEKKKIPWGGVALIGVSVLLIGGIAVLAAKEK